MPPSSSTSESLWCFRNGIFPTPGPGQILVKTEACGVCHTDLHAATGDWPLKPKLPFIPGHEAIGRVVAVGAGVKIVKEGDRVGVPWLYSACGHCEHCLSAWETVCAEAEFGGYTKNGGFAEYVLADPNYVAHIPDGLDPKQAAPLICAGITTYKGIKETEGEGRANGSSSPAPAASGTSAIQYAKVMGLRVCAVDIDDGKLALAKQDGRGLRGQRQAWRAGRSRQEGHQRRRARRPDHRTLAWRVQAGRRHDAQARHLRAGRTAAGRFSRSAI